MFKLEARWLREKLETTKEDALSPVLNLGSSDLDFRKRVQPWIEKEIMTPLKERGIKIHHIDLKDAPGVDITADLMQDKGFKKLKDLKPKSVLCCNMLEHVTDPQLLAKKIERLVPEEGYIFITVPYSYPYHKDPIDTMYRPTPEEVSELFQECEIVEKDIIAPGSYRQEVRRRPLILFRHIFIFPFPMFAWTKWKRSMRKLGWLFTPYKVTCVVLRKRYKPGES